MDLGSGRRGVDMGPSAIRIAGLAERLAELGHKVVDEGDLAIKNMEELKVGDVRARYLPEIVRASRHVSAKVERIVAKGHFPLVLGGDHSISVGTVSAIAAASRREGKRVGLLWVDAHGDINTPSSSLSGNVHGMPVAHLLGHGDPAMVNLASPAPAVRAGNTVIVGVRDLDPAEREHARLFGLRMYTMRDIDERGLRDVMREAIAIATSGTAGFHVSCDADWIDPSEAPGVGTPVRGGATYREGHLAMELVADTGKLVSMDVVEINPVLDQMNRTAELCVGLATSAFGLRIL